MIGQINFEVEQRNSQNITFKAKEAYVLLADDSGYIQHVTDNFIQRFMPREQFMIDDFKVNADEVLQPLGFPQKEDLKTGVRGLFVQRIFDPGHMDHSGGNEDLDVLMLVNKFTLHGNNVIKEYLFVELQSQFLRENIIMLKTGADLSMQTGGLKVKSSDLDMLEQESIEVAIEGNLSSESGSSKSTEIVNMKGAIDFKETPKSLSNLQKAMLIFFIVLIGTSFSVLAVTQVQNYRFIQDSEVVKESISLGGHLANLRLVFRNLLIYPRNEVIRSTFSFSYLQEQMELYFSRVQHSMYIVLQDENYIGNDLKNFMSSPQISLWEVQQDGKITINNITFALALQQYMSKLQKFITIDVEDFRKEFSNFLIREMPKFPTVNQRDAYYLIINGMYDLRSFSIDLYKMFLTQSQEMEGKYQSIVLVITLCCISVTLISSMCLIPITFALDTEQEGIVKQWMMVSTHTKKEILNKIDYFTQGIFRESTKDYKPKEKSKETLSLKGLMSQIEIQSPYVNDEEVYTSQVHVALHQLALNGSGNNAEQEIFGQLAGTTDSQQYVATQLRNELRSRIVGGQQNSHLINALNTQNQKSIASLQRDSSSSGISFERESKIQGKNIQSIEGDEVKDTEMIKVQKRRQKFNLRKMYQFQKITKAILIFSFATIIFGFYIGFYFISSRVFTTSKDSFNYIASFNRRSPCISNLYQFMLETYAQNASLRIGYQNETVLNHAQNTCMVYEENIKDYLAHKNPQIQDLIPYLSVLNSDQLCKNIFSNDSSKIKACQEAQNGILEQGLSNTYSSLYYYLFSEMINFESLSEKQWLRTEQFLYQHTYNTQTFSRMKMILEFLLEINESVNKRLDYVLMKYLQKEIDNFTIIFLLFLAFMLLSCYFAMFKLIGFLKRDVFRSRILVKIIPADELHEILKYIRRKESRTQNKMHKKKTQSKEDKSTSSPSKGNESANSKHK